MTNNEETLWLWFICTLRFIVRELTIQFSQDSLCTVPKWWRIDIIAWRMCCSVTPGLCVAMLIISLSFIITRSFWTRLLILGVFCEIHKVILRNCYFSGLWNLQTADKTNPAWIRLNRRISITSIHKHGVIHAQESKIAKLVVHCGWEKWHYFLHHQQACH